MRFVLFYLLLHVSSFVQSQNNVYFQNHPTWRIKQQYAHQYPCLQVVNVNYFVGESVIIDSLEYVKLYERRRNVYEWQSPLPPYEFCTGEFSSDSVFSCYLRSADRKMYFKNSLNSAEYLIYDFNVSVGDTIRTALTFDEDTLVVTHVDSFPSQNGWLRRINFSGSDYTDFIIEGIGSNVGLLDVMYRPYNYSSQLNCYAQNNQRYHPNFSNTDCLFYLDVQDVIMETIRIFPNPAQNTLTIQLPDKQFTEYAIYSINGARLLRNNLVEQTTEIEISNLESGSYLILLSNEKGEIRSGKFIKSN